MSYDAFTWKGAELKAMALSASESLSTKITAIGSAATTLVIALPTTLTASVTIPVNVELIVLEGGSVTKASTYTLTINGPFSAGRHQVFIGFSSGNITFGQGSTTEVFPEWWGAKGDDSTESGAAITCTLAAGIPISFAPKGIYRYATSPTFAVTGATIRGNGATLKHTGSGNAFSLNGGGAEKHSLWLRDFFVLGNSNSTNGIYSTFVNRSRFSGIRVLGCATTGAALLIDFAVGNKWDQFKCTVNEAGNGAAMPQDGIILAGISAGVACTTQVFINPIIEGLSGDGINLDYSYGNSFYGGISEGNNKGAVLSFNAVYNLFSSVWFEANTTNDIEITGQATQLHNIAYDKLHIYDTANLTSLFGCRGNVSTTIDTGATNTSFIGGSQGGSFTDNGTNTNTVP